MSDDDRFARQRLISGWSQDLLTDATVVVCGLGALGNEVVKNLALAGIGRLLLCDPDTVAHTNLSRTVLFQERDVGRLKVEVVAEALAALAPHTVVEVRARSLTSGIGLAELRDSTVVVGCLDSRRGRLELLGRCGLVDVTLVDGGTGPWSGEVRVRVDAESACYGCSLTAKERSSADLPTAYTNLYPGGSLAASIAPTALVGAWISTTVMCVVLGQPVRYRLLRIETLAGTTTPSEIIRDPGCPHHRPLDAVALRVPVGADATVADLMAHFPAGTVVDAWTSFPIPGTCRRCGVATAGSPSTRTVAGRCPTCGGPVRRSDSYCLSDASPHARLHDLGVAPREILAVRGPDGLDDLVELALR